MIFDIKKWYWIAEDGRVYSAPDQEITNVSDAGYNAFTQAGGVATRWPRDLNGAQTNAALLEVISPYGLVLSPKQALLAYAAQKRWEKEVGGITVGGAVIATDDRSKSLILGAHVGAKDDSEFTTPFVGADGSITVLDADTVIAIGNAVLAHVRNCFVIFSTLKPRIDDGSITTRAEIDTAFV